MLKIINCIKFSKCFCPYIQKFDFSKYSSFRSEKLESKKEQLFYKKEKKILNNERASIKSTKFFSQFQRTYKINDKNIFSMFLQNQFLAYMRSTYSLLPFLFSINLLNNVINYFCLY